MNKRTKIVCTIGPACESVEVLTKMIVAGMNIARLNFSHGTYENHTLLVKNIRAAAEACHEPVALLQDLQGPKIRVGVLPKEGVTLTPGATLIFDTNLVEYTGEAIPVDYRELHLFVKPGHRLLLNDGKMEATITSVNGTEIETIIKVGGSLTSHKGINVPDSTLEVRAMSEKDREDAAFGVSLDVDFIALSFVRNAEDILDLRRLLEEETIKQKKEYLPEIKIIAKIERREAVDNIESILEVVDGIMVARGDLGIEIPAEEVPIIQKKLIEKAIQYAKPVIVATQMLDSMQENPRPTRAEVSDVANAVIDHTDAVMLSNESAVGKYPVETVDIMARILCETESSEYDHLDVKLHEQKGENINHVMETLARILAEEVHADAILLSSNDGEHARLMSSFRPEVPIFVFSKSKRVEHQLNLSWGISPFVLEDQSESNLLSTAKAYLKIHKNEPGTGELILIGTDGKSDELSTLEVRKV
jgi:pyruvate kinase